jgi:hypothetical protein
MPENISPIKVEFPEKIRVTSTEIDSIAKTSERIMNILHVDLKAIIEPLSVLRSVPDLIKEVKENVVSQFTNLLTGQVESDVINRQANIKVLNKKIVSTQKHIEQKEENLDKTIDRVNARYNNLGEQLNKEHETFLHKLDSHAYDIIDKIYPTQIQDRFSFDSLPSTNFLTDHAWVSVADRNSCLEKGMNNAYQSISDFIEKRNDFHKELEQYYCTEMNEGTYELPFCFMEMENRNSGETKLECWFECELETGIKNKDLDVIRQEMENQAGNYNFTEADYKKSVKAFDRIITEKLMASEKERFLADLQPN